ncbi:MAG: hypothetical protein LUE61_11710, partial [Clostridiales bacterium]|nr:hypothetical protein [Clostridiales bacterium]
MLEETYAQLSHHEEERTEPEQEDDEFADIDPEWVRARLAEHGIVNGEVVDPEKLAQSPFIQMVEADVARIAAEEDAAEAAQDEPEPAAEVRGDTLAPEDRFHVVDVDWYPGRPAYSIWDDQTGDYYVDRDGVTIDFVSRWDAEEYRDDLVDTLRQETESTLAEQVEQFDADQQAYREQVLSGLTPDQQRIVTAMETAGFPFRPTETNPIYFGDLDDYPITFDSWEAAYDFINNAGLKDFPGLREQVQAVLHPEPAFPYHAGDTVHLEDGKPFVIESIGTFDVQLRDPALRYPVFRAERRENFLRLMERYPQSQQEEPASEQPSMTEETVGFYPGEQNGLPFDVEIRTLHFGDPEREAPTSDVIPETPEADVFEDVYGTEPGQTPGDVLAADGQTDNLPPTPESAPESVTEQSIPAANFRITDDHLGEGGPKQKYAYNVAAIRTLQMLEAEHRNATPEEQQILSRYVGWGSLADAFDSQKDSWANEYRELKGLLTEEEYAAARASTLNAHYTSPAVIRAIYEAVDQMGFTTGNIL